MATSRAPKGEKGFIPFVVGGAVIVTASVAGLIAFSLSRDASSVKAFVHTSFHDIRQHARDLAEKSEDPERRAAYEAVARSSGEDLPWLPQTHGTSAESDWCVNAVLEGADGASTLGVLVHRRVDDRGAVRHEIAGLSATRPCACDGSGWGEEPCSFAK